MADDKDEAETPDESASAATPDESPEASQPEAGSGSAVDPEAVEQAEEHVAAEGSREPTLEELEQMLQGDDPADHDGADVDPADEPAELVDAEDTASADRAASDDTSDDNASGDHGSGSDPDGSADSDEENPDGELVSVGASPKSRSTSAAGGTGSGSSAVAKQDGKDRQKNRATPKQKREVEKPKRTTPVGFVREAVGELRKVVYPTGSQLGNYFVVVLVFVLFIIAFVGLLDAGFTALVLKVLG